MSNRKRMARIFQQLLNISGYFAQRPIFNLLTRFMMRRFADLTLAMNGGQRKESLEEVGKEWQRMFPLRKMVPIRAIEDDTVYAEVCGPCPVTNTGDVAACHRLMAYDRRLLERIGGEFIVLESQADPDTPVCQVAIRLKGARMDDLTAAHEKPLQAKREEQ